MKLNILGAAISDQLTGVSWSTYGRESEGKNPVTKTKIVLIWASIFDPEPLSDWLNLDIIALKRPAGQRIIQFLLDLFKFTQESDSHSFHILYILKSKFTFLWSDHLQKQRCGHNVSTLILAVW